MKKNNQRLAETIKLTEYGDEREIQLTDLTDQEREIWEEDFPKQLKLRWTHDGKSFVKATGYTGILALPRFNISIEA